MWRNMVETVGGRPILGTPFVGLLAEQILAETATGPNGAGLMYNDDLAAGKRYRLILQGAFGSDGFVRENGDLAVTAPATTSYLLYEDNLLVSSTPTSVTVGGVAPGPVTATVAATGGVAHTGTAAIDATVVALPPGVPGDLWNGVFLEAGLTPAAMLRIILAALVGRTVGIGTATEQYLSQDGTKPRITVSFDAQSNRVTVVLDGA